MHLRCAAALCRPQRTWKLKLKIQFPNIFIPKVRLLCPLNLAFPTAPFPQSSALSHKHIICNKALTISPSICFYSGFIFFLECKLHKNKAPFLNFEICKCTRPGIGVLLIVRCMDSVLTLSHVVNIKLSFVAFGWFIRRFSLLNNIKQGL